MFFDADHVRPVTNCAKFNLANRFGELVSESLHCVQVSVGRIAGVLTHSDKLDQDFVLVGDDYRRAIKSKHSVLGPTFSVERLRTIRSHSSSIKKFVPLLFRALAVANARAKFPVERFISFASAIDQTAITATVNAVESSKKDSTLTGIRAVRARSKCKRFYTDSSTVLRGSAFA